MSKFDVYELLKYVDLSYITVVEGKKRWNTILMNQSSIRNYEIRTKPSYPSDKLTLDFKELARHKNITWLEFYIKTDGEHDIHLLLEDSRR